MFLKNYTFEMQIKMEFYLILKNFHKISVSSFLIYTAMIDRFNMIYQIANQICAKERSTRNINQQMGYFVCANKTAYYKHSFVDDRESYMECFRRMNSISLFFSPLSNSL